MLVERSDIFQIILLGIILFTLVVSGVYMILARQEHSDRSRVFFGVYALLSAAAILLKMVLMLGGESIREYYHVLNIREMILGMCLRYLVTLYPVEVARPGWFNLRRWLLYVLPCAVYVAVYIVLFGRYQTPLDSFAELTANIGKPDVIMRLVLLVFMLPIEFIWGCFHYNPRRSSAGSSWLMVMLVLVSGISFAFVGNMLSRSFIWRMLHTFFFLAYPIYVMYIELFERIPVPKTIAAQPEQESMRETTQEEQKESLLLVQKQVRHAMEQGELWREPELRLEDLTRRVGSNRNYVTQAIQQMGYSGFKDYLNQLRVAYIKDQLQKRPQMNIQDIFYDAGYRSRGSAWRNFTTIVGCSPSEFIEKAE
ncbi:MAG: helix-turn-helix domain-containing protein [Paludibacteraceae bacterium]|nr:helix-turn-helix domain-containing protein [Paludibacteraceae bacterium]